MVVGEGRHHYFRRRRAARRIVVQAKNRYVWVIHFIPSVNPSQDRIYLDWTLAHDQVIIVLITADKIILSLYSFFIWLGPRVQFISHRRLLLFIRDTAREAIFGRKSNLS